MSNLLTAFAFIAQNPVNPETESVDRFLHDAFASVSPGVSLSQRIRLFAHAFAYLGNPTNPPDMLLRGGDAIATVAFGWDEPEVTLYSASARRKIYSFDPLLSQTARECEPWQARDLLYAFIPSEENYAGSYWLVYGDCFASPDVMPEKSCCRMCVKNPRLLFSGAFGAEVATVAAKSRLVAIMRAEKYESFSEADRTDVENAPGVQTYSVNIPNPDDTNHFLPAKLLLVHP